MDQFRHSGALHRKLITLAADRPGHDHRYAIDSLKTMAELDWQPRYLYDQGPIACLDWYRDNQSKLRQKIMSLQNHPG